MLVVLFPETNFGSFLESVLSDFFNISLHYFVRSESSTSPSKNRDIIGCSSFTPQTSRRIYCIFFDVSTSTSSKRSKICSEMDSMISERDVSTGPPQRSKLILVNEWLFESLPVRDVTRLDAYPSVVFANFRPPPITPLQISEQRHHWVFFLHPANIT